jgi:pimeloyl-ACP methyl ester carboxylesterase
VAPGQDLSVAGLAAVLEDFCGELGLTGIDLVANDTGGAIAQIFAARHPQRLATLTLTDCETAGNLPPEAFKPMIGVAAAGDLAPASVEMFGHLDQAAEVSFGTAYEHLDLADREVIRSYLEPCIGTLERAREFERLLVALDGRDLQAVTPQLERLTVPTLIVWGTDDVFFDLSWAYWLRDTIAGADRVVTVEGGRLFFPEERPMDLVPHLQQHWAAVAPARA